MRSIISHVGTPDVPRLRIGIGIPATQQSKDTTSFVLGRFSPPEQQLLPAVLDLSVDAVEVALKQGIEQAMNLYNGRTVSLSSS